MARVKGEGLSGGGHGGKREGAGGKPVTMVRSSTEWKQALEALADWDRCTSLAELLDRAVASYARERGYPGQIPKR
jgi:hypothetical protein